MLATRAVILASHHTAHLPAVVSTLLYIVAVVATILAFVGLLLSLVAGGTNRTGWRSAPIFINWWYAAIVALIAWLLLAFL